MLNDGTPTRLFHKKRCPDISLCSLLFSDRVKWQVPPDSVGSDHFPILLEISEFNFFKEEFKKEIHVLKMDWDKFSSILDNKLEKYNEFNFKSSTHMKSL